MLKTGTGKSSGTAVEDVYQKKTQREHVLLRPDTYIGSTDAVTKDMWVWDSRSERIVNKTITYCPGLFKIFGTSQSIHFALTLQKSAND